VQHENVIATHHLGASTKEAEVFFSSNIILSFFLSFSTHSFWPSFFFLTNFESIGSVPTDIAEHVVINLSFHVFHVVIARLIALTFQVNSPVMLVVLTHLYAF
jgi:hypothetical protein